MISRIRVLTRPLLLVVALAATACGPGDAEDTDVADAGPPTAVLDTEAAVVRRGQPPGAGQAQHEQRDQPADLGVSPGGRTEGQRSGDAEGPADEGNLTPDDDAADDAAVSDNPDASGIGAPSMEADGPPASVDLDTARTMEHDGRLEEARVAYAALADDAATPAQDRVDAAAALARLRLAAGDASGALESIDRIVLRRADTADGGQPADTRDQSDGEDRIEGPAIPSKDESAIAAAGDRDSDGGPSQSGDPAEGVPSRMEGLDATALGNDPSGTDASLQVDAQVDLPPEVHFLRARVLARVGRIDDAVSAFRRYADRAPYMADAALMEAGDALSGAGKFGEAAETYAAARGVAAEGSVAVLAAIREGNSLLQDGRPAEALAAYRRAEPLAPSDAERAQALAGIVAAAAEVGQYDVVTRTRRTIVAELPGTAPAPVSLQRLREGGEDTSPEIAAAVHAAAGDHSAALQQWMAAIEAARAVTGTVVPGVLEVRAAEAERALGDHGRVITRADAFLDVRPQDPVAEEIRWLRARSLEALDRDREAVEAYADLAARHSAGGRPVDALWRRAWLIEDLDGELAAADAFADLFVQYPDAPRAADAAFRSGLTAWRGGRGGLATERWSRLATTAARGDERARALYWLGLQAERNGDSEAAAGRWRQAVAVDPHGYYGLRAAERLGDDSVVSLPESSRPPLEQIQAWFLEQGRFVPGGPRAALEHIVQRDDVRRADAWLFVGEREAALRALRSAHRAVADQPERRAAIAWHAHEIGLPDVAVSAAAGVLAMVSPTARNTAPAALWRLAYPIPWSHLVLPNAREQGVSPSLMYGLMRQESRFEPTAVSVAGATGLTQVMPATGAGIASALSEPGFQVSQLTRPVVAARFGAWYIGRQVERFDGHVPVALSAYNGGPGNAARWWDEADGDVDLFVEIIDFSETRRYVPLVLENVAWYERLYPGFAAP